MTQCDKIIEYMEKHGSITPREAEDHIGCMRLASRIGELKKDGFEIRRVMISYTNSHGQRKRYAQYSLEG